MKYKVGDKVRIKSLDWYNKNKDEYGDVNFLIKEMSEFCGEIMTIKHISGIYYIMEESAIAYGWTDEMIEGLAEEENNACQKCVFAVYDDKPHCGLRGFRSDFNVERCSAENDTIPNGYELQEDGYFSWVEKKKEYPKTYEECLKVLNIEGGRLCFNNSGITQYERGLYIMMNKLSKLLICRDAYWKIAGEEMGLGKPWEPGDNKVFGIIRQHSKIQKYNDFVGGSTILEFPTEEMRDAFYENFKEEIESCKELL